VGKSNPKKLLPAGNGASYPTLEEAGLGRRFLLAGAAALAMGLSCSTQGEPPMPPPDASADADVFTGTDSSGGIWAIDAGIVPPADGGDGPDGGAQGGDP